MKEAGNPNWKGGISYKYKKRIKEEQENSV
jgi:hypothetical protein